MVSILAIAIHGFGDPKPGHIAFALRSLLICDGWMHSAGAPRLIEFNWNSAVEPVLGKGNFRFSAFRELADCLARVSYACIDTKPADKCSNTWN